MGILIVLGLCALLGLWFGAMTLRVHQEQKWNEAWSSAARQLGLNYQLTSSGRLLYGSIGGVSVHAEHREESAGVQSPGRLGQLERHMQNGNVVAYNDRTVISVGADGSIPKSITLRADSRLRSLGRLLGGEDLETGDALFDERVEVQGRRAEALAALNEQARVGLRAFLLELGGRVENGKLIYGEPRVIQDEERLRTLIRSMVALARALSVKDARWADSLAANAVRDRNRRVRLHNFRALCADCPEASDLVRTTARQLLCDSSPPLRLLAAQQLGAEGVEVLTAIAADAAAEPELRGEALMTLAERAPAHCESLAEAWLHEAGGVLLRAAVAVAARGRFERLAPALAGLASTDDAETRRGIAEALGILADPSTEPALIRLLGDASTPVQCAAARSLGSIGSVLAVEPLMPHTEGLGNAERRQAARAAIGQIQSRLGNVEAGRLSLAAEHPLSGAVSLADTNSEAAGALSLSSERHMRKP